jgi:hypothetical protein
MNQPTCCQHVLANILRIPYLRHDTDTVGTAHVQRNYEELRSRIEKDGIEDKTHHLPSQGKASMNEPA